MPHPLPLKSGFEKRVSLTGTEGTVVADEIVHGRQRAELADFRPARSSTELEYRLITRRMASSALAHPATFPIAQLPPVPRLNSHLATGAQHYVRSRGIWPRADHW